MKLRAKTNEQKKEIVDSIYTAWVKEPELRFGQFLFLNVSQNLFYIEDYELKGIMENEQEAQISS